MGVVGEVERRMRMRRTLLVLLVTVATLLITSGVALAVVLSGGPGDDTLRGDQRLGHPLW
jgi:hypothetical protein